MSLVVAAGTSAAMGQELDLSRAYRAELAADAAARTNALAGADCGYSGNQFTLSDGGENTLHLGGMMQARWYGNFRSLAGNSNDFTEGFAIRRTRFDFTGTIFDKRFSYDVRIESDRGTGGFKTLEIFGRYNITNQVYVRFGQFKPALNREEMLGTTAQLAVDRSVANAAFAESYVQGAELGYQGQDVRAYVDVSDGLKGAYTDFNSPTKADYALTGRVEYKWAGKDWGWANDFTSFRGSEYAALAGIAGHWQAGGDTGYTANADFFQGVIDTQVEGDGWNFFAEGIWRNTHRPGALITNDFGAVVQGGAFVSEQAELFARWDAILPDSANGDPFHTGTFGVNYYLSPKSHAVKLSFEASYFFNSTSATRLAAQNTAVGLLTDPEAGEWMFVGQMQVVF